MKGNLKGKRYRWNPPFVVSEFLSDFLDNSIRELRWRLQNFDHRGWNTSAHCSYLDISISPKFSEKKWWFCRLDPGSVKPQKIIFLTNKYENKNVVWWKKGMINTSYEMFIVHSAQCDRLWVVEVTCQVQVTLQSKLINILIWKLCFF